MLYAASIECVLHSYQKKNLLKNKRRQVKHLYFSHTLEYTLDNGHRHWTKTCNNSKVYKSTNKQIDLHHICYDCACACHILFVCLDPCNVRMHAPTTVQLLMHKKSFCLTLFHFSCNYKQPEFGIHSINLTDGQRRILYLSYNNWSAKFGQMGILQFSNSRKLIFVDLLKGIQRQNPVIKWINWFQLNNPTTD